MDKYMLGHVNPDRKEAETLWPPLKYVMRTPDGFAYLN